MGSKDAAGSENKTCGRCIPSLLASLAEEGGLAPSITAKIQVRFRVGSVHCPREGAGVLERASHEQTDEWNDRLTSARTERRLR